MYKKKKKKLKKFSKKFNTRIIKSKSTYSIEEISELLKVHKNTVGTWIKEGLQKIDAHLPYLVFGQDLIDFLKTRNNSKKRPCAPNKLFCCKCQKLSKPLNNIVCIKITDARTNIAGFCETCSTKINKAISPNKIDFFKEIFILQMVHKENLIECTNTCAIIKKQQ